MQMKKLERDNLLEKLISIIDMSKTETKKHKELRTGATLLAAGITQVGIERVKDGKTYHATFSKNEVPDHKSNLIIMIEAAKGQSDLTDKLLVYMNRWGVPDFYKKLISK